MAQLKDLAFFFDIPEQTMLMAGIGIGALMIVLGLGAIFGERNPAAERLAGMRSAGSHARGNRGLLQAPDKDPTGVWKALIPGNMTQRSELARKLARGGLNGPNALRNFMLLRAVLGLLVPTLFVAAVVASRTPGFVLPFDLSLRLSALTDQTVLRVVVVLVAAGYYLPLKWLDDRARARQRSIEEAFPNALDLMQISIEAGLSFDAAMTRVGNELAEISPEIAFEFLTVQRQVQAGRTRDEALRDMALRTGVDAVRSFANVVTQSIRFGTSMSDALTAYARELREIREMRAQEAANKLPVKMSGVLASLMLPALILLTVGPVVIRYARYFGG